MKKICVLICLALFVFPLFMPQQTVHANDKDLGEYVEENLDKIDFSEIDQVMESVGVNDEFFKGKSFKNIVASLISGESYSNYNNFFEFIFGVLKEELISLLPFVLTVLALGIVGSLLNSFKPNINSKSVSDLLHFVCYALVVLMVASLVKNVLALTNTVISGMTRQMDIMFPILLTLLTAMGGVVSASIYNPMVALLTNGVSFIFGKVVYPIFVISFIFVVLGNLTSTVKIKKLNDFLGSSFKWVVGFVFTLFAGFLTIRGISAGRYDTISLKATRFAMKNSIPIIGGYLSDGLDYVLLSSVLIKNAVGVASLLLLAITIIVPLIKIVIIKLMLQLTAGLVEPVGDGRVASFCESCSKVLVYPIVIILAMAFMYFLSIGLIMCTITGG